MRYSKEHKTRTRARIIEAAAPLFRRYGFSAVSVDKLMSAAKLTRGGFYAHFESKDALIEAILTRNAGLVRMMGEREGETAAELNAEALAILREYLDPKNLPEILAGCPLATMPVDAARASPRIRKAYGARFRELIKQLQRGLRRDGGRGGNQRADDGSEDDAIAAAVLAVGGVLLARASAGDKDATKIESACRRHIERLLGSGH